MINRQRSTLQRSKSELRTRKSFQRKKKTSTFKKTRKCYNCGKSEYLSQQCKKSCNDKKKAITMTFHNSFSWTACQDDMCRVYMSDKDEAEWYSQK